MDREELLALIGDPLKLDSEMAEFAKSHDELSAKYGKLLKRYPNQWIAFHSGRVQARAASLEALLEAMDAKGVKKSKAHIRYLDPNPPVVIL